MLHRLLVNTGSNILFKVFSMVMALVSVPVLVSAVGADGYGVILLAGSVLGYFNLLNGGVPAGVVKYVAEFEARGDDRQVNRVIGTSIAFFVVAGLLVGATVAAFASLGGVRVFRPSAELLGPATRVLYTAAGLALLSWPLSVLGQTLDGLQRYPENKVARGIGDILAKVGAIGAALADLPLEVIFFVSQAGFLATSVIQYRVVRGVLPTWRLSFSNVDRETLHLIFGYSLWMLLSQLAVVLTYQTDRVLIGLFLPLQALTIYHVITTPFRYVQQISGLYNSALMPAISASEARGGHETIDQFVYTATRYSNAFFAPTAILAAFFAAPFIRLWVGEEYLAYVWVAQVACLFQLLWQSNATLGQAFYGTGQVRTVTVIAASMAVLNVGLSVWWVQWLGVAGVVLATVAVGALSVPLQYALAFSDLAVDRGRYVVGVVRGQWPSWVAGLVMLAVWGPIQSIASWATLALASLGAAAVIYAATWFLTVKPQHRLALLTAVGR